MSIDKRNRHRIPDKLSNVSVNAKNMYAGTSEPKFFSSPATNNSSNMFQLYLQPSHRPTIDDYSSTMKKLETTMISGQAENERQKLDI